MTNGSDDQALARAWNERLRLRDVGRPVDGELAWQSALLAANIEQIVWDHNTDGIETCTLPSGAVYGGPVMIVEAQS